MGCGKEVPPLKRGVVLLVEMVGKGRLPTSAGSSDLTLIKSEISIEKKLTSASANKTVSPIQMTQPLLLDSELSSFSIIQSFEVASGTRIAQPTTVPRSMCKEVEVPMNTP